MSTMLKVMFAVAGAVLALALAGPTAQAQTNSAATPYLYQRLEPVVLPSSKFPKVYLPGGPSCDDCLAGRGGRECAWMLCTKPTHDAKPYELRIGRTASLCKSCRNGDDKLGVCAILRCVEVGSEKPTLFSSDQGKVVYRRVLEASRLYADELRQSGKLDQSEYRTFIKDYRTDSKLLK